MTEARDIIRSVIRSLRAALAVVDQLSLSLDDQDPVVKQFARRALEDLVVAAGAQNLQGPLPSLTRMITSIDDALDAKGFEEFLLKLPVCSREVAGVVDAIATVSVTIDPEITKEQFVARLVESLCINALRSSQPGLMAVLTSLQFIVDRDGRPSFAFANVGRMFTSPGSYLVDALGTGAFDGPQIRDVARRVLRPLCNIPIPGARIGYGPWESGGPAVLELTMSQAGSDNALAELEAFIVPVLTSEGGPGFRLTAVGSAQIDIPISDTFTATVSVASAEPLEILLPLNGKVTARSPTGRLDFKISQTAGQPIVFGDPDGLRLELGRISFRSGISAADLEFGCEVSGCRIVVSSKNGFLSALTGGGFELPFDLAIDGSWQTGVRFRGGAGLAVSIPFELELGPILVRNLDLALSVRGDEKGASFAISVSTGITVALGPLRASVMGIGIDCLFAQSRGGEGAGNGLPSFPIPAFKLPTGVGLQIDVGPVSGGGFLDIQDAGSRYIGGLHLSIFEVGVTAIGVIDTKIPGREGYAILLIIDVQLPAIQLGFGFTLLGIGGIVGINRRMDTDVARAGLADGTLDAALRPSEAFDDLPGFLGRLQSVFPIAMGRLLVGPKVTIGWGTPAIVTADIGLLIELPNPISIIILGKVDAYLPNRESAVIELHLDILGVIDLGGKKISIDASLHDSKLGPLDIQGDMALLFAWGDEPDFVLSIGGFHPQFTAPARIRSLKRCSIALNVEVIRLAIEAYLAVTPNSLQLGARAELQIDLKLLNVVGWLGFDALITFEPFGFAVAFTAGVALRIGKAVIAGLQIDGTLAGPSPWKGRGQAKITILLVEIAVRVEFEVKGEQTPPQERILIDPFELLLIEAAKPASWSVANGPGLSPKITVHEIDQTTVSGASTRPPVITPNARIGFRQRSLPFQIGLSRVGQAWVEPPIALRLTRASIGPRPLDLIADVRPLEEQFSPGQFMDLTDDEKLSAPAFERMIGGFEFGSDWDEVPAIVEGADGYEATLIKSDGTTVILQPHEVPVGTQGQRRVLRPMAQTSAAPVRLAARAAYVLERTTRGLEGDVVDVRRVGSSSSQPLTFASAATELLREQRSERSRFRIRRLPASTP